ncbi:response regulator [Litorilinea aerophila]|uniref:Response regulator n=1 Tax=Litorilinea aerophila TaxID=1204385 RepID=A0A540VC95_9CHLR|nr:response regulator [Litorilinea aerophila]MCC9077769.1 response regulator [Litorilinea aerophila]
MTTFPAMHPFTPDELAHHIRTALAHLYDQAYLQNHPLAAYLEDDARGDQVSRAQQLRRTLLDLIELLRPQSRSDVPPEATRAYAILTYRYVDGLSMEEIADKLSLSRRQAYREHAKGIEALASLFQEQARPAPVPASPANGDRLAVAQAEVDRLRQNAHLEMVALDQVLAGVGELLSPRLQQTGSQLLFPPPQVWPPVLADRTLLRQALLNLLSQALDAVPPRATIQIQVATSQETVCLRIRAQGEAAPEEATPRSRAGVGMAVARNLIEAQNGQLTVQREANVWHAQVHLPTAVLPTVLVVDDNEGLVRLFQRYLGGYRVRVAGATSGPQALALAAELQPQLVLLDLMLPQQDGWEILKELQRSPQTREIPVAVCSVLNEVELAMAMGARDYITKPVSQQALLELLRRWLGRLHQAG